MKPTRYRLAFVDCVITVVCFIEKFFYNTTFATKQERKEKFCVKIKH